MSPVPFREALRVWLRIGLLSFGGPAGQIALMHRVLVEEKRWIDEGRFLHALNYCMLLPGPEAQQLATYVGWLLHGTRGGLVAGLLFVIPGALCVLVLSALYATWQRVPAVDALFFGLKAAVLAVVVEAVVRIGKRVLKNGTMLAVAAVAFVGIFFLRVPFPLIVLGAGLFGLLGSRVAPQRFPAVGHRGGASAAAEVAHAPPVRPTAGRAVRVVLVWSLVWFAPLALAALALGTDSVLVREGLFFSKTAVVTFGGAYAVLGYVAQRAVETYGWLRPGEMLDGLGLAETTPGPLILVLQFVGFLAAYRAPGPFDPLVAGTLGALVTVWVTFAPCFLWIFLGAPYVEALRGRRSLDAALSSVTAAVVGVVLNLALWFGLHVVFGTVDERVRHGVRLYVPDPATLEPAALALALLAALLLFRLRLGMVRTLAISAALGLVWRLLGR